MIPVGEKSVSSPLIVKIEGVIRALFKPRQREPGCRAWSCLHAGEIYPKDQCTPGTGAFMEVLGARFLQECLRDLPDAESFVIVPKVDYVQIGHPSISLFPKGPSVRGTGSLHEFIPNAKRSSQQELNDLPPIAVEFVAVMHSILLDADAHSGNLLITDEGKVVIIDLSYILSKEGKNGGVFCWIQCNALQQRPSDKIKEFIHSLDENRLGTLLGELKDELQENLSKLPISQQEGEEIVIEEERIITHKIALCFLKKAILNGWTLSQIGHALQQINPRFPSGVVHDVFQEIKHLPQGERSKNIEEICSRKALGPRPALKKQIDNYKA